jgi:hypothetical protein
LPSKLTALGALLGVVSLGLYAGEKSFGLLHLMSNRPRPESHASPRVSLTLDNSTAEAIAIQRRGDVVLWLPQGVDDLRRLPGRYDLQGPAGQPSGPAVVVDPHNSVDVVAYLRAEFPLGDLLDRGVADLEFIFRKEQGGLLFSGSIPFERKAIEATRWKIDLAKKE